MGREIKRVALDFDWPLDKVWSGFLMPESLTGMTCKDCDGSGYSPRGKYLKDLWYGYVLFEPNDNGSVPFTPDMEAIQARADRNCERSPEYYGTGRLFIDREARRLCRLFNSMWCHHLNEDDVAALIEHDHLWDFTRTCTREHGWVPKNPPVIPTPQEVNLWSISGMGHDSINSWICVSERCKREGVSENCSICKGHGAIEAYVGQRDDAENWEREEPPIGDGWQLWETVSEGSPISPVFATDEELAQWMASDAYTWGISKPLSIEQARKFVASGYAPTMIFTPNTGLVAGEAFSNE